MGRNPLSQEQIQSTREKLFEISNRMIQQGGLECLNIRLLCREAGISYSSFYQYYESKDALISSKISALDDFFSAYKESRLSSPDAIINLSEFVQIYAEFSGARRFEIVREIYRIQLTSYTDPSLLAQRQMVLILRGIIENGMAAGQLRPELSFEHLMGMTLSYCKGMVFEWCLHEGTFDLISFAHRSAPIWAECLRVHS